jgi:hypothetical protein
MHATRNIHIYFLWYSAPKVPRVKYVIWNKDFSMVALISKHQLVLATKQLDQLCTVTETYVTLLINILNINFLRLFFIFRRHRFILGQKFLFSFSSSKFLFSYAVVILLCFVHRRVRLKGGCWDDSKPIFIYTTLNHVKYLLQVSHCNCDCAETVYDSSPALPCLAFATSQIVWYLVLCSHSLLCPVLSTHSLSCRVAPCC